MATTIEFEVSIYRGNSRGNWEEPVDGIVSLSQSTTGFVLVLIPSDSTPRTYPVSDTFNWVFLKNKSIVAFDTADFPFVLYTDVVDNLDTLHKKVKLCQLATETPTHQLPKFKPTASSSQHPKSQNKEPVKTQSVTPNSSYSSPVHVKETSNVITWKPLTISKQQAQPEPQLPPTIEQTLTIEPVQIPEPEKEPQEEESVHDECCTPSSDSVLSREVTITEFKDNIVKLIEDPAFLIEFYGLYQQCLRRKVTQKNA
ncbi:hypothetical protein P9112_004287 [Eukaryota sp. TZLM1-RC]